MNGFVILILDGGRTWNNIKCAYEDTRGIYKWEDVCYKIENRDVEHQIEDIKSEFPDFESIKKFEQKERERMENGNREQKLFEQNQKENIVQFLKQSKS